MADEDKTFAIDYRDGVVMARDTANQDLLNGQVSHKTFQLGMFTTTDNAKWAADRFLKELAYPYAIISFPANRNLFRLVPGNPFVLNYAPYGISGNIYRVLSIQEEGPASEKIEVRAILDVEYASSDIAAAIVSDYSEGTGEQFLDALDYTKVIEAPYVLTGTENITACTIAARLAGVETEHRVFLSFDGASYSAIGNGVSWAVHGLLVDDYSANTYRIDDDVGIEIDFDFGLSDVDRIESVGRSNLLVGTHLALLGDELISFQLIAPVSGDRYRLTGIFRGRYDTEVTAHSTGAHFYWLNEGNWKTFLNSQFLVGTTRYFKYVPHAGNAAGDISEASVNTLVITGRARTPYRPFNLRANSLGIRPVYFQEDVVLSWAPRLRGNFGAGKGVSTMADAAVSWEGLFKVEVYVGDVLVRTTDAINDDTWTYTGVMNQADNGGWASDIVFKVSNYIVGDDSLTYESITTEIAVKEG